LQEPQDNVLIRIGPGSNYKYKYQIHSEQPAGTYFYHPHIHGSSSFQVNTRFIVKAWNGRRLRWTEESSKSRAFTCPIL